MTKTNRFFRRERSGLFLSKYYLFTKTIYQIVDEALRATRMDAFSERTLDALSGG